MIAAPSRNGAGGRVTFPREPLLLTTVTWPFEGPGYDGVLFKYNVSAVRRLLDNSAAALQTLTAGYNTREQAILAEEAPDADKQVRIDALLLEWAHAIIGQVIYRVEWPYVDAPPDPAEPAAFDCWDAQAVLWLARDGLAEAGASFLGPLSLRTMPRAS